MVFSSCFQSASHQGTAARPTLQVLSALEKGASVGFAFSGGGFLLPYFVGVVSSLRQVGLLQAGTPVAGSSAGSLIAASVSCGLSTDELMSAFKATVQDCRQNGHRGRLSHALAPHLVKSLPEDAHERCSGTTTVGITRLWPRIKHKSISRFQSKEDLVSALLASCHIPLISTGSMTTDFRGRHVVDGGITNLIPEPHSCDFSVKISCIPMAILPKIPVLNKKKALANLAFAPDSFGKWPYSTQQTLQYALDPPPDSVIQDLLDSGKRDAMAWAKREGLLNALSLLTNRAAMPPPPRPLTVATEFTSPPARAMAMASASEMAPGKAALGAAEGDEVGQGTAKGL